MSHAIRTAAKTPVDIPVRTMGFAFPSDMPRHWVAGDPFETHLFNALSLTFPIGEKQFIDSVRFFADRITDPALKDDVRAFVGQEIQHSREHEAFNAFIEAQGLPAQFVYDFLAARIAESNARLPPIAQLAATAALEHFTAIMAKTILDDPELYESMEEPARTLWLWHAIEETEHKSVAFDVFEHVGGTYETRVTAMAVITVQFIWNQMLFHRTLMRADGQMTNLASWARGIYRYWGPRGRFTRLVPDYLQYYRRDFHPWQDDNRSTIAEWKRRIEAKAKRVVPQATKSDAHGIA